MEYPPRIQSPGLRRLLHSVGRSFVVLSVLSFCPLCFEATANPAHAPASKPSLTRLQLGTPIRQQMPDNEQTQYGVVLAAGQFMRVSVDQREVNVVVRIYDEGNRKLLEHNNPGGAEGAERVSLIAESSGTHRIEVELAEKSGPPGQYTITLEALREPLPEDRERLAGERAFAEGEALRLKGEPASLRKAIEKFEAASRHWRSAGEHAGEAHALTGLGWVLDRLGESQKSLAHYQQALVLHREAGHGRSEAVVLNNLGGIHHGLGENQKALDSFNRALSLRRALGDRSGEAQTLNGIGGVYLEQGDSAKAADYFGQALAIHRSLKNRAGEAYVLHNLCAVHTRRGELQKSLNCLNQVLALRRELKDREGEAITLNNLGGAYQRFGASESAVGFYQQALGIHRSLGDPRREASGLNNLGNVYRSTEQPAKALEYFQQALLLRRATGDRRGEAITLNNIGSVHRDLGQQDRALEYFNQALPLRVTVGDLPGQAVSLRNIGLVYASLAEIGKARDFLDRALQLSRTVGDRPNEATSLAGLSWVERADGNLQAALSHVESALEIRESMRAGMASDELRASFFASSRADYELLIDILVRQHESSPSQELIAKAFHVSERARARSLLDLLAEAEIDVAQGIDPALKQEEQEIHSRLSRIQGQLVQFRSRPSSDAGRLGSLESELKQADNERRQLELQIRSNHPAYAELRYPEPLKLHEVQQKLAKGSLLLEYFVGQQGSFLFAVTESACQVARLPGAERLEAQVKQLREAVSLPGRAGLSRYLVPASSLYREVIQPASSLLGGREELVVAADGILHYLPFELLLKDSRLPSQSDTNRLPYLLRDFAVSYIPSASILASLAKRVPSGFYEKSLVAYADPASSSSQVAASFPGNEVLRNLYGAGNFQNLKLLPHARGEVEGIAKLFPAESVRLFSGEKATEESLKAEGAVSRCRLLHFATHGVLNERYPQFSGLLLRSAPEEGLHLPNNAANSSSSSGATRPVLADASSAPAEDGLLQVYEIFNLKLNADLVVLSACETGLGKAVKGEGLIGLTRAFLYAGTPSVMVSLWKVADKSTADLMVRFYRYLSGGKLSKSRALRQAQLDLINSGNSHPYHWAPFVLVGKP